MKYRFELIFEKVEEDSKKINRIVKNVIASSFKQAVASAIDDEVYGMSAEAVIRREPIVEDLTEGGDNI